MTAAARPVLPPRPAQPAELRRLILSANADTRRNVRALRDGDLNQYVQGIANTVGWDATIRAWFETGEGAAYTRDVHAYNTALYALRTWEAAQKARRAHARQVSAVRAAACTRCYSTHPGEC